jgi:hypothetical protein
MPFKKCMKIILSLDYMVVVKLNKLGVDKDDYSNIIVDYESALIKDYSLAEKLIRRNLVKLPIRNAPDMVDLKHRSAMLPDKRSGWRSSDDHR